MLKCLAAAIKGKRTEKMQQNGKEARNVLIYFLVFVAAICNLPYTQNLHLGKRKKWWETRQLNIIGNVVDLM